jgi:hypothetical protein
MRSWRRLHDSSVIAQVEPVSGFGTWRVSAWQTDNPEVVIRHPSDFQLLTDAQTAADALAQKISQHTCYVRHCGHWLARAG